MIKYIALLRGINVGGKNKVSMKELRELLEKKGFQDVVTYINSGNIIFSSDNTDIEFLKRNCEALIFEKFKLELSLMVISAEELIDALSSAPEWWDVDKEAKHNAIFVIPPTTVDEVFKEVGEIKPEYEKVSSIGRVIFWSAPLKTFSRTRWSKVVGKSVYNRITIRNANTVKKLVELCKSDNRSMPTTDEELQKNMIGELKPHNAPITLVEYDPSWPDLFEREANRIRSVLGNKALQIEHVGSTSVPGLCAKPIIDMILVVENSAEEPSYVPAMEATGYTLRIRESDWFEHRLFKGPDTDINLHVFSSGTSEIDRMLRFRDWLRSNETDRDKYAQVKRSLAKNKWRYVQHYADAKTSIVQEIMERANAIK